MTPNRPAARDAVLSPPMHRGIFPVPVTGQPDLDLYGRGPPLE